MNIDAAVTAVLHEWERRLVAAFCVVAAIRVFAFSAAFPFFNNVDEQAHVDLVMKYARGDWPRAPVESFDPSAARLFVVYGTPEYLNAAPASARPLWQIPDSADAIAQGLATWTHERNHESGSSPVYYVLAAAWYRLGGAAGLREARQLYWVRFLNVGLAALLVACGYALCRRFYPDRLDLRVGVPALVACLPQDVFYSVNSDVLSPLLCAGSLMLIWNWHRRDDPPVRLSVAVGLAVAASFLVKYTNVFVPVVFAAVACLKVRRRSAVLVAASAAVLPVAVFWLRNAMLFGDWSGADAKAAFLGWSPRPVAAWFAHPILSVRGFWTFWSELMKTFWRGEFVWHLRPIASSYSDAFYVNTSTILLAAAAVAWRKGRADRIVHASIWAAVILSVLCLVFLSVRFEYGQSLYPSPDFPYFISGRLIGGMLIPFLVLYVDGLAFLLKGTSRVAAPLAVVAIACAVTIGSELALSAPMFADPFNWFHLR